MNRRWPKPSKWLHPPIYYTKQLIAMFHIEREVSLFCDIHGHSRKKNVFMYGCANPSGDFEGARVNNLIRIVPLLLSQRNRCFSYKDCTFLCEKEKESTARIVLFKELGIPLSYTLEASFFGALIPPPKTQKPLKEQQQQLLIKHDAFKGLDSPKKSTTSTEEGGPVKILTS